MDIRDLTAAMSVGPQIALADLATLKERGVTLVIDNRPDEEVEMFGGPSSSEVGAEAARLGIAFAYVPIPGTGFGADEVRAQREAVESAAGPVFAYCRSGTRSANVWALAMAGSVPAEELIEAGRNGGYDLAGLAPMLANRIE